MWGITGFVVAALLLLGYAYVVERVGMLTAHVSGINHKPVVRALWFLSAACLLWAFGVAWGESRLLETLILVGDTLLVGACVLMASVAYQNRFQFVPYLLAGVGFTAIAFRAFTGATGPEIRDSILVFHTPVWFGAVLMAIVVAAWIPASKILYEHVARPLIRASTFDTSYLVATYTLLISLAGFMLAKKTVTIVTSFILICLALLVQAAILYIAQLSVERGIQYGRK